MDHDYLVSCGVAGDVGRFRPVRAFACRRGDEVVVHSPRGLELGVVLCEATPGHAVFFPNTTLGQLLRPAGADDIRTAERLRERGQALFDEGRRLTAELGLPLEIVDVEVLLDEQQAVVHHLPWAAFEEQELIARLARPPDLFVTLFSLAPAEEAVAAVEAGCGRPDCGSKAGGCSTCGSGGCSSSASTEEVQAYFLELRQKMQTQQRVPLL